MIGICLSDGWRKQLVRRVIEQTMNLFAMLGMNSIVIKFSNLYDLFMDENEVFEFGCFDEFQIKIHSQDLLPKCFHFIKNDSYEVILRIKDLNFICYLKQENNNKINARDKMKLIKFLSKKHEFYSNETNWNVLNLWWDRLHGTIKESKILD